MKKILPIILCFIISFISSAQGLEGCWEGKLSITPQMSLRIGLNIIDPESENPAASLDSPDQGAYGIPTAINFVNSDSINISVSQLMLSFQGKLENDSIKGNFVQGGLNLPLNLIRKTSSLNRPQTPIQPFPYNSEEVSFLSSLDNAPLYGTLSLPVSWNNETPIVVLISGSGTQNRDEEIFEHKPFAVISDYLARNGIASLRYDDRGFDPSTGLTPNPTTFENYLDSKGAVDYIRKRGFNNIGIIGHSEGGLIADMLAAEDNNLNFIIEIGGPSVSGDKILLFQNDFLLRDGGMPEEIIGLYLDAMRGIMENLKAGKQNYFIETDYEIFSEQWLKNPVVAPLAKNLKENFVNPAPWIKYFINYDPISNIKNIQVPALFIYGEKDTQVPPSINVPVLEKEFPQAEIKVYPELNHLMQPSKTGKIQEYAQIEETISPQVLEDFKTFILSQKNKKSKKTSVSQKDSIRDALNYQMTNYPTSQYRDIYKNFMQDYFGPGHLLNDTAASGKYLRYELSDTDKFDGPDYEPTGFNGNFYRVNLRLLKDGTIPYNLFFETFVESVRDITPPAPEDWKNIWGNIDSQIRELGLSFPNEEKDRETLNKQFEENNFIVHHSEAYNNSVNFHYRIISRKNFQENILPLIKEKKLK